MANKYKEIIYLNTTELNSVLSQLNQGLLESLVEKVKILHLAVNQPNQQRTLKEA